MLGETTGCFGKCFGLTRAMGSLTIDVDPQAATDQVADDLAHNCIYNGLNRLTVLEVRQGDGD